MRRLYAVLVLALLGAVAGLGVGPEPFRLLAVGLFVLVVPGLLLIHVLRIGDPLLEIVIGMVTGPALWLAVSVAAAFAHLWHPRPTIVLAAVLSAVLAGLLLRSARSAEPEAVRSGFSPRLADDVTVKAVGRHRGAFPSPYDE